MFLFPKKGLFSTGIRSTLSVGFCFRVATWSIVFLGNKRTLSLETNIAKPSNRVNTEKLLCFTNYEPQFTKSMAQFIIERSRMYDQSWECTKCLLLQELLMYN